MQTVSGYRADVGWRRGADNECLLSCSHQGHQIQRWAGSNCGLPPQVCLLDYPEGVRWPLHSKDAGWRRCARSSVLSTHLGPRRAQPNGTVSGLQANGYTLVNLAGSYDLGNGVSACARIDNLFDRRYQRPDGVFAPRTWCLCRCVASPSTRQEQDGRRRGRRVDAAKHATGTVHRS